MDLAFLTGQRPTDILKLKRTDLRKLWVTQGKIGTKLRISVTGSLATVISRVLSRKHKVTSLNLVLNEKGEPLSYNALRYRFESARKAAEINFQFRDIRAKTASDLEDAKRARKLLGMRRRK